MVEWASTQLDKSQANAICKYWDDAVTGLAAPGVVWEWGESPAGNDALQRMHREGLIEQVNGGWETTEAVWLYVIDRAADDEDVGSGVDGQETLAVDPDRSRSRSGSSSAVQSPQATRSPVQTTLTGDPGEIVNDELTMENARRNKAKGEQSDDGDAVDEKQRCLHEFEEFVSVVEAVTGGRAEEPLTG